MRIPEIDQHGLIAVEGDICLDPDSGHDSHWGFSYEDGRIVLGFETAGIFEVEEDISKEFTTMAQQHLKLYEHRPENPEVN